MFNDLISAINREGLDVHAIEVLKNGIAAERHIFDEDRRYPVYSITKSVTSSAFSMLCDDGLLSPDMPLYRFLPNGYEEYMTDSFKALTFERFLTMTAGDLPFRPTGEDWLENCLTLDTDNSDTGYHYSNIPAYLVGVACENVCGSSMGDFLEKRLFDPLGIKMPKFAADGQGRYYGATGIELTVHELSMLGQLYLQNGSWNGFQIISEDSVRTAVASHVRIIEGGYGYFFRTKSDHYMMSGKWGQRCIIYPEKNAVISYLSHLPENSDRIEQLVEEYAGSF